MRKLLLLPVLLMIFSACDREDPNVTLAKSLAGTYDCTRKGFIRMTPNTGGSPIDSPIDYTYTATITYLGDNRIQLDMGGVFTGSATTIGLTFDTYTISNASGLIKVTYNIDMTGGPAEHDWKFMRLSEIYSGTAQGPEITYRVSGNGETYLKKK